MLPLYGFQLGPALFLYPFRFVDPVMGNQTRARYRAERRELEQRYVRLSSSANWRYSVLVAIGSVRGNAPNDDT
jgi:hypothetical protein